MREVTTTDLVRLALLMMSVGTIVLGTCLLYFYRRSERLGHVAPLALAHTWLSVVVTLRGWDLIGFEPALWNAVGAYTLSNIGLGILLFRPLPSTLERRP